MGIYQRAFVQFSDNLCANKYVKALNGLEFEKYKLSVTWTRNSTAQTKIFCTKQKFVKVVGFSSTNVGKNKLLQFLYANGIEPQRVCLIFKYSLSLQMFLQFDSMSESVQAMQVLNTIKFAKHRLYARYSCASEFEQSKLYSKNIKKIKDEIVRRSQAIDILNVSWDSTVDDLTKIFSKCGKICKVHICHRKDLLAGTAFIEFEKESAAEMAIMKLNGHLLNGYRLRIAMHLKQTNADKKLIKAWYTAKEEEDSKQNRQRKEEQMQRKKEKAKRKRLRRAMRSNRS